jgi:hypothetical protein
MNFNQLGDVLVCMHSAHKPMMGRDVQPVLAVQQPQASTDESIRLAHIPDAVDWSTDWMHPKHGANTCGYRWEVRLPRKLVDFVPKTVTHGVQASIQLRFLAQASLCFRVLDVIGESEGFKAEVRVMVPPGFIIPIVPVGLEVAASVMILKVSSEHPTSASTPPARNTNLKKSFRLISGQLISLFILIGLNNRFPKSIFLNSALIIESL